MKKLLPNQMRIATGERRDIKPDKVLAYRQRKEAEGYELPPLVKRFRSDRPTVKRSKPIIHRKAARAQRKKQQAEWAYGITTVPNRRHTTLPRTLKSLRNGGFDSPRLFVDDHPSSLYADLGLQVTFRGEPLRTHGNWLMSLYELYLREPNARYYAVFQDDCIVSRNLRSYLEQCEYPENGYWNLLTFPPEGVRTGKGVKFAQKPPCDGFIGWYESNQNGLGAVSLVFDNANAKRLLSHEHMVNRVQGKKYPKCVDGGIVESFRKMGGKEYVHSPSLAFHIGDVSTMSHGKFPDARSFRGEDFDAMDLLPSKKGLGDLVESALSMAGITEKRVSRWLGRPCGCSERKQKLNQLGDWASRLMRGDGSAEELESLM